MLIQKVGKVQVLSEIQEPNTKYYEFLITKYLAIFYVFTKTFSTFELYTLIKSVVLLIYDTFQINIRAIYEKSSINY